MNTIKKITLAAIKVKKSDVAKVEKLKSKAKDEETKKALEELMYTKEMIADNQNKTKIVTKFMMGNILVDNAEDDGEKNMINKILKKHNRFIPKLQTKEVIPEDIKIIKLNRYNKKIKESLENEEYQNIKDYLIDLITEKMCKHSENVKEFLEKHNIKFKIEKLKGYKTLIKEKIEKAKLEIVIWLKKCKHIVSFSGGKDSSYLILKMLDEGMKIDEIVFVDTMLEYPEMYAYIEKFKNYIKRDIKIIRPEHDFEYYFYSKYKSGKNKGRIMGFPHTIGAWCNSRLKIKPLERYFKEVGPHVRYLGIAYNEPIRYERLDTNEKAPLYEWKITEDKVVKDMKDMGLLNPLYEKFDRLGCWLCPKQSLKSLRILRKDYPELWNKLLQYDKDSPVSFKPNKTVRDLEIQFGEEDKQINMFDFISVTA